jgi:DNA-binding transcriptional MerR regulator
MLSPQKNRSGQRSYRKKDVETAIRIKQLLYDDMYTIAGARKKLNAELRDARSAKPASGSISADGPHDSEAPTLFDNMYPVGGSASGGLRIDKDTREALSGVIDRIKELQARLREDPFGEMPSDDIV